MDLDMIEAGVRQILAGIGEDPAREGLLETPGRVARMYAEILAGFGKSADEEVSVVFTSEVYDEIILVKDIPFSSMCEHHMVPFIGKAHVAYIPAENRITGLSKLARVVDAHAKRLQLQERLTAGVADTLVRTLRPRGVVVVVEAEHLCMTMRGVQKPGAMTVTSAVRGIFQEDGRTRAEAFALIRT
ncbi:MAG: GTP cyclohydrolase I FolE [Candidatus Sericytochromatia bacterium]|nr:GTP cyclohydrolase I FolE [Candidatus Sericytochromatia bacterium]